LIECKQVYMIGVREHFRQYYNVIDFSILALYMASYALRFATYYRVTQASVYFNASARIEQAMAKCDLPLIYDLMRETNDHRDDPYGYFMIARTLCDQLFVIGVPLCTSLPDFVKIALFTAEI